MTSYCGNKLGRARLHSKKEEEKEEEKSPVLLFCVCVLPSEYKKRGRRRRRVKENQWGVFSLSWSNLKPASFSTIIQMCLKN
jgi:hypothetical protein